MHGLTVPIPVLPYLTAGGFGIEHIRAERETGSRTVELRGTAVGAHAGGGVQLDSGVFVEGTGYFGCRLAPPPDYVCFELGGGVAAGMRWKDGRLGAGLAGTLGYTVIAWDNVGFYPQVDFEGGYVSGDGVLGVSGLGTWDVIPGVRLRAGLGAAVAASVVSEEATRVAGPRVELSLRVGVEFDLGRR